MSYSRNGLLFSALLSCALASSLSCGTTASTVAPDLPGDGTANLVVSKTAPVATEAKVPDPWEGHELIAAPAA